MSVFKSTIQITALSLLNIFFHFAVQMLVAFYFGTTDGRDAYFAAAVIPAYLTTVTGCIGMIFLPVYVDIKTKSGIEAADKFYINTVSVFGIGILFIVLVIFVSTRKLLVLTVPGFTEKQLALAVELMIILLPTIFLSFISTVTTAVLQIQKQFFIPALGAVISILVSLCIVWMFHVSLGIRSLAYGTLIGSTINCLFIRISVRKPLSISFKIRNEYIGVLLKSSVPLMIGSIISNLSKIIERALASTLPEGSISYLGYASQIMAVLSTIAASGIAITVYPLISEAWSVQNFNVLNDRLIQGVRIVLLLSLPITAVFIFWGTPIIQILLERGEFTHQDTLAVSSAFKFLNIAFIAGALGNITAKCYYFSHKTLLLLLFDMAYIILYIFLSSILIKNYSYRGLSIALSIALLSSFLLQLAFLKNIIKHLCIKKYFISFLIILLCAFIPIISIELFLHFLHISISSFLIPLLLILYIIGYYFILKLFKIEELNIIQKKILSRLSTRI
jgi:putative peptidoglycan lipid II flippase